METIGLFTGLYNIVVTGIKQLPDLFAFIGRLPFVVQELISIAFLLLLPKIFDLIDFLKDCKSRLDDSL